MSEPLYTDDDVERAMNFMDMCTNVDTRDDGFWVRIVVKHTLDAVLPAIRTRWLTELADQILADWDGDILSQYAADWLRVQAEVAEAEG